MSTLFAARPALVVFLFSVGVAAADDTELLRRELEVVQEQNRRLQAQLDEQGALIAALVIKIEGLAPSASDRSDNGHSVSDNGSTPQETSPALEESGEDSILPSLFIRGFADTTFRVESDVPPGKGKSSFGMEELDLLLTSRISPQLSVLSEVVFHFDEFDDDAFFELERIYLNYEPTESLSFKLGRVHTPLGYWNRTFHHGNWFQTTVSRPILHRFEDEGGILPSHSVGLEVGGTRRLGSLDLSYGGTFTNGRGSSVNQVQNVQDVNNGKALNFFFDVSPASIPGLSFGVSGYSDEFSEISTPDATSPGIDEAIFLAHGVFLDGPWEILAEVASISHTENAGPNDFSTLGAYVQAAYELGDWKPYYRFDFQDIDETNPVFAYGQEDVEQHTVGTRWDLSTWLALKFEYVYQVRGDNVSSKLFAIQSAFTF